MQTFSLLPFLEGSLLLEELLETARSLRSCPSFSPREGGVAGMAGKFSLQSVCMYECREGASDRVCVWGGVGV